MPGGWGVGIVMYTFVYFERFPIGVAGEGEWKKRQKMWGKIVATDVACAQPCCILVQYITSEFHSSRLEKEIV